MENMQPGVVLVRRLTWDMETVEVDRSRLLRGQVRLVDVGRGRFEARIDGPTLAQAAGVDLRFREGAIEIHKDVRGVDVFATARASMEENLVRFEPTSVQGVGLPPGGAGEPDGNAVYARIADLGGWVSFQSEAGNLAPESDRNGAGEGGDDVFATSVP